MYDKQRVYGFLLFKIAEYFSVFISPIREFHLYLSIVNETVNV